MPTADPITQTIGLIPGLAFEYETSTGVQPYLSNDAHARWAWHKLADYAHSEANRLRRLWGLTVTTTTESDPYADAAEQARAISRGHLRISSANCDHPLWTPAQNVWFRTWHDMSHFLDGTDFSPEGELETFQRSAARMLADGQTRHTAAALFSESVYQLAYSVAHGSFLDPQRCVLPTRHPIGTLAFDALLSPPEPF